MGLPPLQPPFSCLPAVYADIEKTIFPARLARFSSAANGDRHLALCIYIWNARLCEEFYLPIQFAEVGVRNLIHYTLTRRYGERWFESNSVVPQLPQRHQADLQSAVQSQRQERGRAFTADHVVAGLPFGFWVNLLTIRYEHILWQQGMRRSFPHAPRSVDREAVYLAADKLRTFRNAVAHHYAIFDRGPTAQYQNIQRLLGWISPDTVWLMKTLSNPARVLNARPTI